jgi:hypothetical protein
LTRLVTSLVLAAGACGERARPDSAPPAGTEWLSASEAHWEGWIELVPAIRTPRFSDGRDETRIYARLPEGSAITLTDPANPTSLEVPAGAELDRVERFTWRDGNGEPVQHVVDVRGTRFFADREELHVYRPMAANDARLFGLRWDRIGAAPPDVVETMRAAMREGHGLVGIAPARRDASIDRFVSLLACEGCHQAGTRERVDGVDQWPRRPTDASGLYSVLATLSSRSILETYRPHDENEDDPFVRTECVTGSHACRTRVAVIDLSAGLAAGDSHAVAVCASRRALSPFLSDEVRLAYRAELDVCDAL